MLKENVKAKITVTNISYAIIFFVCLFLMRRNAKATAYHMLPYAAFKGGPGESDQG